MSLDDASTRRVGTLVLLVAASVVCVVLTGLPVDDTWEYNTSFLIWNLALAWLPFVFALAFYDGYRRGRGPVFLGAFGLLWLLFLPNAPYIVTDGVHLRDPGMSVLWFDALLIGAFALTGLVLGLGSLFLVQAVVTAARGPVAGWVTGCCALVLSSVGIYLGRFVGVNSWDAVVDPGRVLAPILNRMGESLVHPRFFAVTVVFTTFLLVSYLLLYCLVHSGLALEPRRPARR
jgi:uncharacterized membrane protein